MSDKMRPIGFNSIIKRIDAEYKNESTIFGIHAGKFFKPESNSIKLFGGSIETPLGPAAGPHTQLAQNIISAYLTGGRFFELKTVQCLDELKIDKPCIDASDEAYNVEWSQELKLTESYREYLKAWLILHLLKKHLKLSGSDSAGFLFNMSVGYNLEGIKSHAMDSFINKLKDARHSEEFNRYRDILYEIYKDDESDINKISPCISNSVTLSTMHGCPPEDIEAIARYLIKEKGLHTYVKLNPTLLGFEAVRNTLNLMGYSYIDLDSKSFSHDLQMTDAVPMLKRLKQLAADNGVCFGVKLSNTLGVNNKGNSLPGDQMYMSGRSLFPLTIDLADYLAREFNGNLSISFSGGASVYNITDILKTGIYPVTIVTDLLKPGGYTRLFQTAGHIEQTIPDYNPDGKINLDKLDALATSVFQNKHYLKGRKKINSVKVKKALPEFDCYIAPCIEACPAHQDIPSYIRLTEKGSYSEALNLILESNSLPHITGYICDHKCMSACTRLDYDEAVEIREIKKTAALNGYDKLSIPDKPDFKSANGIKAAVIGAGPSGLSAALYLRKSGFEVTVFEKSAKAGGTVQHIIPEFRLPQSAIDNDIELIKNYGIKFVFGIDENFSIESLKTLGYKYIYVAIGASLPNELQIEGRPENIVQAIEFLKMIRNSTELRLGKNVAVIGGGNSAMDAARAALRIKGVEKVYIVYRRTKEFMPADPEEYDNAVMEGAILKELLLPKHFDGKTLRCVKMVLGEYDEKGRRQAVPSENEFEEIQIDYIISAIGEHTDRELLKKNELLCSEEKNIRVNSLSNESMLENVFIGGDALRGPATVIEAVSDGRKAAEAIAARESGNIIKQAKIKSHLEIQEEESIIKRKGKLLFENSNMMEACLSCDLLCNKCVEVCPNRANVAIRSEATSGKFKDKYQILHLDALCNECGNCAAFCPYEGAPYREKVTLFNCEEDFLESSNNGFYFLNQGNTGNDIKLLLRSGLNFGEAAIDENGEITLISFPSDSNLKPEFLKVISGVYKNYRFLLP